MHLDIFEIPIRQILIQEGKQNVPGRNGFLAGPIEILKAGDLGSHNDYGMGNLFVASEA
jgi:hypothetical protein